MNKDLIVLCGNPQEDISKIEKIIDIIYHDNCDIIIITENLEKFKFIKSDVKIKKEISNDLEFQKLFSYKCLEWASYFKDEIELEGYELYNECFFIDTSDSLNIKLPKNIKKSIQKSLTFYSISDFDVKKLENRSIWFNNNFPSSSFWHTNSLEFDILSKFYKGKFYSKYDDIEKIKDNFDYIFYEYIGIVGLTYLNAYG
jgi:hypothetical protein